MVALLEREHAVVWPEIEAKLAEVKNGPQPHILTKARVALVAEGVLSQTIGKTRGGSEVPVWHFTDLAGRERSFEVAAGRKRLLYARFQSWSSPRKDFPQGLIGPAGESVVHQSLLQASPYGYRVHNPKTGQTNHLLGAPVAGGPLDNAAFLQVLDSGGLPATTVITPIEVKNIRQWIYPTSAELFQLLHKAAILQADHPDLDFVPVLVCRRRSFFAWAMGKELGFFPIEVSGQYVLPRAAVDHDHFNEVRAELGYTDLRLKEDAEPRLIQALTSSLPKVAEEYAARWKVCGPPLLEHFKNLREYMPPSERSAAMEDFRDEAGHLPDCEVKW